jgi:hypothetical protein
MANASIFSQFLQPVRSMAQYADDADERDMRRETMAQQRRQSALQALVAEREQKQYETAQGDQELMQRIMSGLPQGATAAQRAAALRATGRMPLVQRADAEEKADLERRKVEAGISKDTADTLTKHLQYQKQLAGSVFANPSPQAAVAALQEWQARTGQDVTRDLQAVQGMSPDQVKQWAAGKAFDADKFLPVLAQVNTGKQTLFRDTNVLTNPGGVAPITMTTTPGEDQRDSTARAISAATNARIAADAAAGRAQSNAQFLAGQSTPQYMETEAGIVALPKKLAPGQQPVAVPVMGADGKPVPGKDKPLTEGQAKALNFATRMSSANKTLAELEKEGRTISTPGSRAGYGVGAAVNVFNTEKGQQLDQAKRDFVNAVLRRESGAVIADSEFNNADKQYFPQIGDSESVIRQKARNREIAIQGVKADVPKGYQAEFDRISSIGREPAKPAPRPAAGGKPNVSNW